MNVQAEQAITEASDEDLAETQAVENEPKTSDDNQASSEFALKMINAVKSMNCGEITHYEMVNAFNQPEELRCLYLFISSLPHNPIEKIYPEAPFLFFKGVPAPIAFELSEEVVRDIETFMKGQNSEYYADLRLHDLEQGYIDSYESGIRIYNDMVEKTRGSYHASVKHAKSQVIEISAVFVCVIIIFLAIFGLS